MPSTRVNLSASELKKIEKDYPVSELVPVEEAAPVFLKKMSDQGAKYGESQEERLANYIKVLREVAAGAFGVIPVYHAAGVLGIRLSTFQNATGPNREKYFPKALVIEKDPLTLEEKKTYSLKLVCIFHRDFVNWVRDRYHPRYRETHRECKINELLRDPGGNWLPEEERPVFTYTDESGEKRAATLQPCNNKPNRASAQFCGAQQHGKAERIIYRQLTGGFSQMGFAANLKMQEARRQGTVPKRGRPAAKRERGVEARKARRNAARLSRRVAYVPENFSL